MTVTIRTATVDDLAALADIFRRASLSNEGDRPALTAHPEALEFPGNALADGRTRVAVDFGGTAVGFSTVVPTIDGCELEDLFVHPAAQRQGVGRTLILDVVATATAQGLDAVTVVANPHADDFYRSVGFVVDGPATTEFGPGTRMHVSTRASSSALPIRRRSGRGSQAIAVLSRQEQRRYLMWNMAASVGFAIGLIGERLEFSGPHGHATGSPWGWLMVSVGGAVVLFAAGSGYRLFVRGRRLLRSGVELPG